MLRQNDYDRAEDRIPELLKSVKGHVMRPDELVEQLRVQQDIPEDIGSTVMWELIGEGELDLSDEWSLSLSSEDPASP